MKPLKDIFRMLFGAYGEQHWWPAGSPFEMMTGAILTQNTSWSNVERAIANFGGALTPDFVIGCPLEELRLIVRPSGFFNQKAGRLKGLARWFKSYGCDVEAVNRNAPEKIRAELLSLGGVGRETADSIMLYAFGRPYFVIDAYTRRVFARLGCDLPETYEGIRDYFESRLPRDSALFNEFHALIVRHAKVRCKAQPDCPGCPLESACAFAAALDKTVPML
jgi:endonuclease-3 related protein